MCIFKLKAGVQVFPNVNIISKDIDFGVSAPRKGCPTMNLWWGVAIFYAGLMLGFFAAALLRANDTLSREGEQPETARKASRTADIACDRSAIETRA